MSRAPTLLLAALLACGGDGPQRDEHDEHGEQEDHHEDGPRRVTLSPEALVNARLQVEPAALGPLTQPLTLAARLTLDPRREAIISAWLTGQVERIDVRPGDLVARGQALAAVQSTELSEAIAAYRSAQAQDAAADARLERLSQLEADGVASHAQVLEAEADHAGVESALEAAEERLRILGVEPGDADPHAGEHYASKVSVPSPISGTVLTATATIGQHVAPGERMFHVADLSELWLLIDVFEPELSQLQRGQALQFTVAAWPGEAFTAEVEQVGDWVDPETRSVSVRALVDNSDGRLKPNMFATATLDGQAKEGPEGVLLPAQALTRLDGEEVVFIEVTENSFEAREVQVAARSAAQVRLVSGVTAGERVVTVGAFTLKSELEKSELGGGHGH